MSNLKWDQRFLELADLVATWSKDPSTKVGAVIVNDRREVVSLGFNGFARGIVDDDIRYEAKEREKYPRIIHAEENALLTANTPVRGCTLYSTVIPCPSCAAKIIQTGIKRVVTRWSDGTRRYINAAGAMTLGDFAEAGVQLTILHNDRGEVVAKRSNGEAFVRGDNMGSWRPARRVCCSHYDCTLPNVRCDDCPHGKNDQ